MSGGFYKYRCKYFYTHNCTNWVYVNNAPCAKCLVSSRLPFPFSLFLSLSFFPPSWSKYLLIFVYSPETLFANYIPTYFQQSEGRDTTEGPVAGGFEDDGGQIHTPQACLPPVPFTTLPIIASPSMMIDFTEQDLVDKDNDDEDDEECRVDVDQDPYGDYYHHLT